MLSLLHEIIGKKATEHFMNGGSIRVESANGDIFDVSLERVIDVTKKSGTCIMVGHEHYDGRQTKPISNTVTLLENILSNKKFNKLINYTYDLSFDPETNKMLRTRRMTLLTLIVEKFAHHPRVRELNEMLKKEWKKA